MNAMNILIRAIFMVGISTSVGMPIMATTTNPVQVIITKPEEEEGTSEKKKIQKEIPVEDVSAGEQKQTKLTIDYDSEEDVKKTDDTSTSVESTESVDTGAVAGATAPLTTYDPSKYRNNDTHAGSVNYNNGEDNTPTYAPIGSNTNQVIDENMGNEQKHKFQLTFKGKVILALSVLGIAGLYMLRFFFIVKDKDDEDEEEEEENDDSNNET